MASLLAPLFAERAENRKIIDYIMSNDVTIDDDSFAYYPGTIPFSYEEFETFCDEFFAVYKDTMEERGSRTLTVSGEGIEVSRLRGQGGMMTILRKHEPQPQL